MMYKKISCVFALQFFVFCLTITAQKPVPQPGNGPFVFFDDDYNKYDWQTFYKLEAANKPIDLLNPNIELLNAAIFYACNEVRQSKNIKSFIFGRDLRDAAQRHSRQMCDSGFFGHNNRKDTSNYSPRQRVKNAGGRYFIVSENLARIIPFNLNNAKDYSPMKGENLTGSAEFKYFEKSGKDELTPCSYIEFAKKIVKYWLNQKAFQENLLSTHLSHLACGIALTRYPFARKNLPFIYVVGDLGGYKLD